MKAYTKTVLLMKCKKDKDFVVNRRAIIDATEDVVASVNASEEQLNKFRGAMVDHPDRLRLCVLSKGASPRAILRSHPRPVHRQHIFPI